MNAKYGQSLGYNFEGYAADTDPWARAAKNGYMPIMATGVSFSIGVDFTFVGGAATSLDFVLAQDGFGMGITTSPTLATPNLGLSFNAYMISAENSNKSEIDNILGDKGIAINGGIGPASFSFAQSVDKLGKPTYNYYELGISPLTSRELPSPAIMNYSTLPVTNQIKLFQLNFNMKHLTSIFLLTIVCLFTACDSLQQCEDISFDHSLKESFSGEIKEVYIKKNTHGTYYIVLNNNEHYPMLSNSLVCFVTPGDSIVNKKGQMKYNVIKLGTWYGFYPECGNWEIKESGRYYNSDLEYKTNCKLEYK